MNIESVGRTPLFAALDDREKRVIKKCAEGAFLDLCFSGCMFHSLKDSKVMEDYFCAGYRMYFEHALTRLHADLRRAAELV
jgi:sulfatase maturation enzyme AslB (radical SAM superfamily)